MMVVQIRKSLLRSFRNQRGQSLIEILTAAAILIVAAGAGIQMVTMNSGATANSQATQEFSDLVNQIRASFATESSCRATIKGTSPQIYSAVRTVPPEGGAQPIYLYSPSLAAAYIWDPLVASPPGVATGAIPQWHHWQILKLRVFPDVAYALDPTKVKPVVLLIQGERTDFTGTQKIRSTEAIRLSLRVDLANNIISCAPLTYGTDILVAPLCPPGSVVRSDGVRMFCRQVTCATGLFPVGYDSLGNVICGP